MPRLKVLQAITIVIGMGMLCAQVDVRATNDLPDPYRPV